MHDRSRTTRTWLGIATAFALGTAPAFAQSENLCRASTVKFLFFNGVATTFPQAKAMESRLKRIYGERTPTGLSVQYDTFYNYSNGLEDFVETFEQRLTAQDASLAARYELFFEVLKGNGSWLDRILAAVPALASVFSGLVDSFQALVVRMLSRELATPPTLSVYGEFAARIDALLLQGNGLVLFAHSQGNLFANVAHDYAVSKVGTGSVKSVHAAPAAPTVPNPHTLADLDLVIQGLRLAGTVPGTTDTIPGYLLRPAGINGQKDFLGHGLAEIYLNPGLPTRARLNEQVAAAFRSVTPPARTAQTGFFTANLTWNGTGDVDLHVFEPNGTQVYYRRTRGTSGFLDVDNTTANGPENYFATCESAALQTGTYRVAVNHYSAGSATGATVQISTSADGIVDSRSLTLGPARGSAGDAAPASVVNVAVSRTATGGWKAEIAR